MAPRPRIARLHARRNRRRGGPNGTVLEKAPEHIHTYRITALSLWNAAVAGVTSEEVIEVLTGFARYPVAEAVTSEVAELMGRYGRLWLTRDADGLVLAGDADHLLDELRAGRLRVLVVSKVANFSIDLPEVSVNRGTPTASSTTLPCDCELLLQRAFCGVIETLRGGRHCTGPSTARHGAGRSLAMKPHLDESPVRSVGGSRPGRHLRRIGLRHRRP